MHKRQQEIRLDRETISYRTSFEPTTAGLVKYTLVGLRSRDSRNVTMTRWFSYNVNSFRSFDDRLFATGNEMRGEYLEKLFLGEPDGMVAKSSIRQPSLPLLDLGLYLRLDSSLVHI